MDYKEDRLKITYKDVYYDGEWDDKMIEKFSHFLDNCSNEIMEYVTELFEEYCVEYGEDE